MSVHRQTISETYSDQTTEMIAHFKKTFCPSELQLRVPGPDASILSAPPGFVGLYVAAFTGGNLRFPLSTFLLRVLDYFKIHVSVMHPLGITKIISFVVICRAYDIEPTLGLFRTFFNISLCGDWVTVTERLERVFFNAEGLDMIEWRTGFVFVSKDIIPPKYMGVTDKERVKPSIYNEYCAEAVDTALFLQVMRKPFELIPYPEPILYLGGITYSWEGSEDEPVIIFNNDGM